MKELILEYLNNTFYCSGVDNAAYRCDGDTKIGFVQIESNIIRTFHMDEDLAHILVFNWLLYGGIKLVRKNWDKGYITHNTSVYTSYETTLTEDIDFEYKMINE